ncbi:MAG: penicillin-binding protein 1C [Bacteroidales bacterium]|nr:penicillin-binding protein 1C [Bacteroidales bacterium]
MANTILNIVKKKRLLRSIGLILSLLAIAFWFCLPEPLFDDPYSTVIEDRKGKLLGAKIAEDGQWRFPYRDTVPDKFAKSIVLFEDRYFFWHPGINPVSLFRAAIQNAKEGEIVSGGSTLSMQVIRLSRKGKPRTIREKMVEIVLALRLELRYSKDEILALYAAHAPFGGNVVGLEAAAWRYYGRPPDQLSWAEAATMAVLPNAPSLIYPGKNHQLLLNKRDRLLSDLFDEGLLTEIDLSLAISEPLPGKPMPINQAAPHLLSKLYAERKGALSRSTLDYNMQAEVSDIIGRHHKQLKQNEIHNAAALVLDVESGEILAWVGNVVSAGKDHGCDVDMVTAPRSTGSILKPILYASMLEDGLLLPNTLVPDIPTQFGGFNPVNFDKQYAGAVPAQKALYRSLNVPAVRMLQEYGVPRFYNKLIEVGMSTLSQPSDHYGLSLILGGAETTMFDLATMYGSFSRVLNHFYEYSGKYDVADFHKPIYLLKENDAPKQLTLADDGNLSASSIWFAYEAMRKVNRPEELAGWNAFASSGKIAWKTGTSFGFRDAWAVGTNPGYVVVVWAGNADGEGRPGLVGVSSAAPIMFDIFNILPGCGWFDPPKDEMSDVVVCRNSGYRAGMFCSETDTCQIPMQGLHTGSCPYHHQIHLDPSGAYRVSASCISPGQIVHVSWFVLPPVMEWYFRKQNPMYQPLPPFLPGCLENASNPMAFVYPVNTSKLFIPVNLNGEQEAIVLEIAHSDPDATVFWHLDQRFLGETNQNHQMEIQPEKGDHILTIVDNHGNSLNRKIEIISKDMASGGF